MYFFDIFVFTQSNNIMSVAFHVNCPLEKKYTTSIDVHVTKIESTVRPQLSSHIRTGTYPDRHLAGYGSCAEIQQVQ